MSKIKLKKLDMSNDIDQQILLTYFFKKPDTIVDKNELLKLACICYDSSQQYLYSHTKRFKNELSPFKNTKILQNDVDITLQKVLSDSLIIQEELVRCDIPVNNGIDHFYIAVIGVDFFLIEKELRE